MSWNGDVNMITKMHHTGFVVRDLDSCVAFYRDVLGLTAADPIIRIGPGISQVVGYDQTELRRVFLAIADGHVLELIQYVHPLGADRPTEERNAIGASHLAFEVDDIEETFELLVDRGAQGMNPPVEIIPGRIGCYLQDPEGNWIELLEISH